MKKFPDFNDLCTQLNAVKNTSGNINESPENAVECSGLSLNSQDEIKGKIFIAIPGSSADGREYIQQASDAGACAVICEAKGLTEQQSNILSLLDIPWICVDDLVLQLAKLADYFYDYPAKKLKLVGVTGTNGKTSVCQLTADIISRITGQCGQMGTLGNGLAGKLKTSMNTTSDVLTIRRTFAEVAERKAGHLIMEVSSHALHQGRVAGLQFDVVVLTNLSRDHLDYHHSLESYAQVKRSLFTDYAAKYAVLNKDDEFARTLIQDNSIQARKIVYSIADKTEVMAEKNRADGMNNSKEQSYPYEEVIASQLKILPAGQQFLLQTPWGEAEINIPLLGQFNLSNVLAVVSILGCLNFSWENIVSEIHNIAAVPGRMEVFIEKNRPVVVVDYAHTPDALLKALTALRTHCQGKLWCVFGCGGDRDSGKRALMAAVAEKTADEIVVTDDNPRFEDGDSIIKDILTGIKHKDHTRVIRDRYQAIAEAIASADTGDTILIAGKGHEDYQLVAGKTLPFSDRDVVKEILKEAA